MSPDGQLAGSFRDTPETKGEVRLDKTIGAAEAAERTAVADGDLAAPLSNRRYVIYLSELQDHV